MIRELAYLQNESEEDRKSEIVNFVEYANARTSKPVNRQGNGSPYSGSFVMTEAEINEMSAPNSRPTSTRDVISIKKENATSNLLRRMREED